MSQSFMSRLFILDFSPTKRLRQSLSCKRLINIGGENELTAGGRLDGNFDFHLIEKTVK